MKLFNKKAQSVTMSDVQTEFTAKAQQVLETQNELAEKSEKEAVELTRKADVAKAKANVHSEEANKAANFIDKVAKMFE